MDVVSLKVKGGYMMNTKVQIVKNMGLRYATYRLRHEMEKKLGVLKKKHPINPPFKKYISLEDWRENLPPFFFNGKDIPLIPEPQQSLRARVEGMKNGEYVFFGKKTYPLGENYDWVTHPITQRKYNVQSHWSTISDFSSLIGDIKYVWEKARFGFLTDFIRYDFHFQKDESEFVFDQVMDFIEKNPINCGPNYRCSQEISLRIMNWTLALYYYKDSPNLTEEKFSKIMHAIYWQLHHIYNHIQFSRIAVRNNHALTETLTLYLSGLLFPFMPNVANWSRKGKKWFEKEVEYQIYPDGTFLQFSMNYHRVVVQLLTWALQLTKVHDEELSPVVKERAALSLKFLDACSDPISGKLPNYGNNDGALFFRWTEDDFRVYTSQLNDLRAVLYNSVTKVQESQAWYGLKDLEVCPVDQQGVFEFKDGGYYVHKEDSMITFLRCGAYKDRPFQSDNLHLDIWKDGINYLWDNGSYRYNTAQYVTDFFTGCEGHNTLSIDGKDQMLRGNRFIWSYWVKEARAEMTETNTHMSFLGTIAAFEYLKRGIEHTRTVEKKKGESQWIVKDKVEGIKHKTLCVYWQINPKIVDSLEIECKDQSGNVLRPFIEEKWHSSYYGVKSKTIRYCFMSKESMITTITIKKDKLFT